MFTIFFLVLLSAAALKRREQRPHTLSRAGYAFQLTKEHAGKIRTTFHNIWINKIIRSENIFTHASFYLTHFHKMNVLRNSFFNKKVMAAAGFEPAPPKRLVP